MPIKLEPQPKVVGPTPRWTKMFYHPEQHRLRHSEARFKVVVAGKRSGKTEIMKREGVEFAIKFYDYPNGKIIFGAPTHKQAKHIYWNDLKALTPKSLMAGRPSESDLVIRLVSGNEIQVVGMDEPARIEGSPIDWINLDEFANMRADVWKLYVRASLSDRNGIANFIGVPEGRNHFYRIWQNAGENKSGEWDRFHWISADILPESEILAAKQDLDHITYLQEYEASFVNFEGRAYYAFDSARHAVEELKYDPDLDLIFCFDFNVSPGTASVIQEQPYTGHQGNIARRITAIIGEVYIQDNSNTIKICKQLASRWAMHKRNIYIYGDPSGGARGTAKVEGSDWDLVKKVLKPVFGQKLKFRVDKGPPRERVRVNAVNSRLKTENGVIKLMVDPKEAPHVADDFDAVVLKPDGSGEIDKKIDPMATHYTDGVGYYIAKKWAIRTGATLVSAQF